MKLIIVSTTVRVAAFLKNTKCISHCRSNMWVTRISERGKKQTTKLEMKIKIKYAVLSKDLRNSAAIKEIIWGK